MEAKDIEKLAAAIIRQQGEAAEKAAADKAEADRVATEAQAAVNAAQTKADRIAAEKEAAEQAERDRIEAETRARINVVLTAKVGDAFTDRGGVEHRVVGAVDEGVDTVARDGSVGNWRSGRSDAAVLATWKKKD